MNNDLDRLFEENSKPLPSKSPTVNFTNPTSMYSGQTPDMGEQQIKNEKISLGLLSPSFLNGKWNLTESGLTKEEVGDTALAFTIGEGSKGWGERSIQKAYRMVDQFENKGDAMFTTDQRETHHWEQFVEGINFFNIFGENETFRRADEVKKILSTVDPSWTQEKQLSALTEWQESNPEVNDFVAQAGINIQDYVLETRNQQAFIFNINEAVQQARLNIGMQRFEKDNGTLSKLGNSLVEGIKDPLILRDMALTSVATLGLGTVAGLAGVSARALSGSVAAGVNSSRALRGLNLVRQAANTAALATGPMTGLIEGPAYAAIRAVVPSAGRSAVSTLSARGLALALEGGVAGAVSSLADQKADNEWRSLVFADTEKALKYNLGETALAALTGSLGAVGVASAVRFGLGSIGDYKYYKTGDWDGFRRQIANSMDTWATTKDGDIVWGNTLSDGRGIFFGDTVDKFMKSYDGRDFTNVMLNGSRLFGKFNPRIAGKMNLDVKRVMPVIEEFEKATGVAGEAAMLSVDGVDPETRGIFNQLVNESNLADADLTIDDVKAVLVDYNTKQQPQPPTATGRLLTEAPVATQQVEVARQLKRLVAAKSVDRRLEQIGLSSATVLNDAEATLGRSINLSSDADFQNFITAARYEAASVDESQVVNTFKRIVTGDFGGGRVIPKEVVDSIFVAAFGDKPIVVTATGSNKNFAVVVDPKNKDVFATKRTLEKGKDGQLSIKLRADDPKSPFFSKDVLTVDTDTLQAKLVEVNEKLNKAWNDVKTAKIKETIEKVKKTKVKEELVKTFAEGTSVTVDSIKKIFDLTKEEATVAKLIMDSLGYDGDSNLLRIASLVADDRNAEIFFEGNTALIRATKSSDVGTVTHEMSHYLQVMILDELTPDARHAIGITDEIWEKFKDWVGYTGTEWTEKASEKFANGMSQYVRRVMSGDGRAPKTQVQRLFHRIGDHLGDLGQRFKSQEALEAGMIMSKEAEDVFEALFNRSNSKIGELFDSAYQGLFKRLPKEQRLAIGKEILGEMAFNDYLAKKEIEFEKAKPVVDKLAEASATKPVTVTSVVNEIYEKVNNATRKVIKEAIASGMSKDFVINFLKESEAKIGTVTSIDTRPANKLTKPTKLTDEELAKFAEIESPFISVVDDVKVKFIDAAFKTEESKLFFSKEELQAEIKRRAASKVSKTETDIGISSELKADLEELLGPGTFVDSAGMKVELTPTETVVATKVATVVETAKVDKEHATAVIAALEEGRTLDAVEAERAPIVTPEVINVEETPVSVETELVALAAISTEASATADSLGESIPAAKKAEVKTVVAAAVANPSRAKALLEKYTTTKLEDVAGVSAKAEATTTRQLPSDLVKQFLEAELRAQISRHTIEGIMGLDDKNFNRFLELEKLATKHEGPLDALVREPTPANLQATANIINWSMEDLKVYVSGSLHKRNGSLIAEFVGAKKFVERNIDTIKETRKYLEDKKSAYDAARAVPEANRSKAQEDLIKKYDKAKGIVTQFTNSVERLKIGVLGNTVLEVVPQKISKAKSYLDKGEAIQTKWLQLQSLGATIQSLVFKNMIEADPITILKAIEKNLDRIAELVEKDGEEVGVRARVNKELSKLENWANGNITSKAASSFVKKIIRNLELNAKRRLEGTKKKVGSEEVVSAGGDAVNVLEGAQKLEKAYTGDEEEDFYVKQHAESEAIRNLATLFHAHLVNIGKTELAAVFMARREGTLQKASDIDNTARLLENYGIQLTVNSVKNRISDLRNELTTFVDGLEESEAKAIRKLLDLEFKPKKQKTLAQRISPEDMEDLSERLMSAGPLDVIRAPDYLIRAAQESSSDLYRRILSGELENGVQVLEELANNPQSKYNVLAGQILNEHRDYLETVGVWVAKLDNSTEGLYFYDNIFLNVREGKVSVPTLIHEVIHAITAKEISEAGFDTITGRGYDAYITALRNSVQSGVDLNGNKLKASVKSIASAYLATIDWIDRTPEALELLGSDYKEKFVGMLGMTETPTFTHYALTNLHEFVANTLTDSDVLMFFAGAKASIGASKTRPVKEMLNGISRSIFPRATEEQVKNVDKILQETIVSNLVTGVVKSKVEPVDQFGMVMVPKPGYVPFRLVGTELQIPEVVSLGGKAELRSALKSAKGRVYAQMRAMTSTQDVIDAAKSVGADARELEAKLAELVDSAEVRRRNLLAAGLHEEMEPEDLEIINSMIKGTKAFSQPAVDHLTRRTKPSATVATASRIKFSGKNYRDLTDDERRSFVSDVLLPTVEEKLGNRNRSAGIYSLITDSKVGKGFNSLVGGGAAYGDTADAQSMMLQFFSKIYDPLMDLRDGELSGTFDLFSVDMVNAETNNMYSAAGLLDIQRKITAQVTKTAELEQLYETAWLYLANLESLPSNAVHRELIVELIKGVHKYNTLVSGLLEKYGTLIEPMKPTEYGTIHKVNMLAFEQQDQFVDALVKHALTKERESKDLSIITLDALGWVKLTRDSVSDDIVSVEIKEGSPLGYEPAVYKYSEFKNMAKKASLGKDALTIYEDALVSSRNYVNWDIYRSRGDNYTALRHTMTVAKNRYLNIDSPESRGGKPRTEGVGGGREMDITRILSHNDIAQNPELAKYFDKDIYGLIYQQLRSSVTDAIMTKYITDMFGVKMSFLDLVEVSRKHGEASRGQLAKTEQDSVNRGYDRIKDIWESNTGKLMASKDGLDRHYRSLLESGSRPLVLSASGLRAALTSTGETARAILASNHNRGMLRQVIPNFIQTLKLFSRNKRQTIQQVASATHWLRGLSSDHLLLRAEMNPNNPFGGTIMGSKQGGWFKSWAASWAGAKERNKLEDSIVGKAANYLSIPASRLGAPLAFVNDITTTLHVQNMQYNLTTNSSKFMALAKALKSANPESLSDFASLATKCGLSPKEAIDLSALGLLDPARIQVMIDAAKDQRNYSEGLLDIQRLFLWADGDPIKIDTINRMGALVNATSRHTNTDPTLLDLRINQSPYARSMGVFMQFLLSHSTQEIGRRRRYTTTAYSKHLAGLVMMESIAYSLARTKDDDEDSWIWEDAKEKPIQTVIKVGTSLPLLGSYQYLSALIRMGLLEAHSQITGEKSDERYRIPDLYSGPSENVPKKALDMIKDLL
jgi:3-methyladenine DNA glycosylase AlkC